MNTRMNKYHNSEENIESKRTVRNRELYRTYEVDNYNKFDVNSNVSILKDNAHNIDLDQIREILDKKYNDNMPKRKSIDINFESTLNRDIKEDTKEYDLNSILLKAKKEKDIDYEVERLNKAYSGKELVEKINSKYSEREEELTKEERELESLINTITALEMKNQKDAELLDLQDDKDEEEDVSFEEEQKIVKEENEFYTGELVLKEEDFDDFKDMEKDIKSNSILIKILVFIFIIILLAIGLVVANNLLELGLFNI